MMPGGQLCGIPTSREGCRRAAGDLALFTPTLPGMMHHCRVSRHLLFFGSPPIHYYRLCMATAATTPATACDLRHVNLPYRSWYIAGDQLLCYVVCTCTYGGTKLPRKEEKVNTAELARDSLVPPILPNKDTQKKKKPKTETHSTTVGSQRAGFCTGGFGVPRICLSGCYRGARGVRRGGGAN